MSYSSQAEHKAAEVVLNQQHRRHQAFASTCSTCGGQESSSNCISNSIDDRI